MATGETLISWNALGAELPASSAGGLDSVNARPVIDLATGESVVFSGALPRHYGGGGVTITLVYAMTSATANNIVLETAIERNADNTDYTSDSFATASATGDVAVPGTAGLVDYTTTAHTSGAQMDSLAVGEAFRLKVTRGTPSGTDATGDLELISVEIRET